MNLKKRIKDHINKNRWQYILVTIFFLLGMLMGDYQVSVLEGGVRSHLSGLVDNYLQENIAQNLPGYQIFNQAFLLQTKTIALMWFLGLTVIGLPLILAVIFLRGLALGFTLGFLFEEKASTGVLISLMTIMPQNLVYVPFLVIWAVMTMNFSIYVVKGRNMERRSLVTGLISYTALLLVFQLIFMAGVFIEAYLSPWLLSFLL